ncbi:MAG: germination protein YpeB [Clostridia bacterium]|nr:germination protein YpeB [Clostridia bacterium]
MKDNERIFSDNSAIDKVEKIAESNDAAPAINPGYGLNGTGANGAGINGTVGINGLYGINQPIGGFYWENISEEERLYREGEMREEREKTLKLQLKQAEAMKKRARGREDFNAKKEEAIKKAKEYDEAKSERKAFKKSERERKRRNGSSGNGGWVALVSGLCSVILVLGSLLALSNFTDNKVENAPSTASVDSERAYYDFVGYVDNIDVNIGKFMASSDDRGRQKILGEITTQSFLADAALAQLPLQDESKFQTAKRINQIGDYAKYLNNRLIDGESITPEDFDRLISLRAMNLAVKSGLNEATMELNQGAYDFDSLVNQLDGDGVTEKFDTLEEQARDYPEMIYDGPFSDGLDSVKVKGLNYDKININTAVEKFDSLFTDYEHSEPRVTGKIENGKIVCYAVRADIDNGEIFALFSEKGGKLIAFNAFRDCSVQKYSEDECLKIAENFLKKAGFDSMTDVWGYASGNVMRFNFVYQKDGAKIYPDMVKVNVCMETGRVSAINAETYFINHTERNFPIPEHTLEEAAEKINKSLKIEYAGEAVIPKGNGNETSAYEFICDGEDGRYYVYIDSKTLKQADIFKVVETAEGALLI